MLSVFVPVESSVSRRVLGGWWVTDSDLLRNKCWTIGMAGGISYSLNLKKKYNMKISSERSFLCKKIFYSSPSVLLVCLY